MKNNAFEKFLAQNIFGRKLDDDNFSHKLFGIENDTKSKLPYDGFCLSVFSNFACYKF